MSLANAFGKRDTAPSAVVPPVLLTAALSGKKRARPDEGKTPSTAEAGTVDTPAVDTGDSKAKRPRTSAEKADPEAAKAWRSEKVKKAGADEPKDTPERLARTVFIGNLPLSATTKTLNAFIQAAINATGKDIDSVRFRNVPIAAVAVTPGSSYKQMVKAAFIKHSIDKDAAKDAAASMNAYVVLKSVDSVDAVMKLNGTLFEGHHLRVDRTDSDTKYDYKRTIFLGNLHFSTSEEEIRALLTPIVSGGSDAIESIRVVRDRATHTGKGIAFVLFKERAHVAEALGAHGKKMRGRDIRVTRCSFDGKPEHASGGARASAAKSAHGKALPKFMGQRGDEKIRAKDNKRKPTKRAAGDNMKTFRGPKPRERKPAAAAPAAGAGDP